MEILDPNNYDELEDFLQSTDNAMFLQSPAWGKVKDRFLYKAIVVRNENNKIIGSMSVLIRKILFGYSLMYSPRGPVLAIKSKEVINELFDGAYELAKKYNCYALKLDPNFNKNDRELISLLEGVGVSGKFSGNNFLGSIQPSVVYVLDIKNKTEDEVFASLQSRTRSYIRHAKKTGVRICHSPLEDLEIFYSLLEETCKRDHFTVRPISYFKNMLENLKEHARLYIAYYNDTAVCGAILITFSNRSLYLYGASSNENRETRASQLLQWEMISHAISCGKDIYDFGGIAAVDDPKNPLHGLYTFKKKFNGEVIEYIGEVEKIYKPFINTILSLAFKVRRNLVKLKTGKRTK